MDWRLIADEPPPQGRVRFLVTNVEKDNQDPTNPFPGDPYDGIELMSGPFDHPDGPRFLNHNSGNYCSVKHWTHWMPLPEPPAAV